jgi:hypothetical protein
MSVPGCSHRPPCPTSATRWRCGQRTLVEDAVRRGLIARAAAEALLRKYGVPMTPASRVMKGEGPDGPEQKRLL